jgi:hypothetical protein
MGTLGGDARPDVATVASETGLQPFGRGEWWSESLQGVGPLPDRLSRAHLLPARTRTVVGAGHLAADLITL